MKKIDLISLTKELQQPEAYRRLVQIDYRLKEYAELNSIFNGNSAMIIKKVSLMIHGDHAGIKRHEDISRNFEGIKKVVGRKESLIEEIRAELLVLESEVSAHKKAISQFETDYKESE